LELHIERAQLGAHWARHEFGALNSVRFQRAEIRRAGEGEAS